jgi:hypothetical protein
VLFLPGNRGRLVSVCGSCTASPCACDMFHPIVCDSYQQARSVGSALGFMSGKLAVADVFTVDFEEEATAGFGDLFWEQATFVNDAVVTIRSLYEKEFGGCVVGGDVCPSGAC